MTHFVVENGQQRLNFDGELLSFSSSKTMSKSRWIEFTIYCTNSGKFIISRIGKSLVYHTIGCPVVKRSDDLRIKSISEDAIPCVQCNPMDEMVFLPEKERTYASVSESAVGLIDGLYQFDDLGNRYLTMVARNVIEDAAQKNKEIAKAYYEEYVD